MLVAALAAAPGFSPAGDALVSEGDLLVEFQRIFAPGDVPPALRAPAAGPAKCATALVREFAARRAELPPDLVERIDGYLRSPRAASSFETEHFRLLFEVEGPDAVPPLDAAPANGIPDWIESVASWAETSWQTHVISRGLAAPAPPGVRIEIAFREMSAYGYTERVDGATRLVLHRDFEGFPANDDPAGSAAGAAKVTAAHESMHAIQWAMSGWTEGAAWLEADATYSEEVVFDGVNDYVRYLSGASPIGDPAAWAWSGPGYEDCLWQHAIAQSHGDAAIVDFFRRRASHRAESVTRSFDEALRLRGSSLAAMSARLAVWSALCGANAAGRPEGFAEAESYPTPAFDAHLGSLPSSVTLASPGLGTRYVLATAPFAAGRPQLFVSGEPSRSLAVHAITLDRAGARRVRSVAKAGGHSEIVEIAEDWADLVTLTLAVTVTDAAAAASPATVSLDDDLSVGVPVLAPGSTLELLPNRPNPFAATTTIGFSLSREGSAHLAIYDLAGRLVRTLVDESAVPAGRRDAVWDGLDDRGARVAPGVYAVRLAGDAAAAARKIHLLR